MNSPIFKNISQALHFSFSVEHEQASIKSSLRYHIGNIFGYTSSSIDFGNLNQAEINDQCATVRALVAHHLLPDEKHSIWARYGRFDTKRKGIEGIAAYVEPECKVKGDALLALTCNFYGIGGYTRKGKQIPPLPLREISKKYEIETTKLFRAKRLIAHRSVELELIAFDRLNRLNVCSNCELAGVD